MSALLLVGTRKGLVVTDRAGRVLKTAHLGNPVSFATADPVTGTWWASLDHGHWGQKLQRSDDQGATWTEVPSPKYPEGAETKPGKPASLEYIWSISAYGGDVWIGTNPGGLFHGRGDDWQLNEALWNQPSRMEQWFGGGRDTPGIHSIWIDPRDRKRMLVAISCAGVFETKDGGESWIVRNKGLRADFLPDKTAEVGHDPHILDVCTAFPDTLWQQNHCGIWRSDDGAESWDEVSEAEGPARFGFVIVAHPHRPEVAWVVPATSDEKRLAPDTRLCVCRTEDSGKTWRQLRAGLPQENAFDVVYRHAAALHGDTLVFGSTTGNVYLSDDGGEAWRNVQGNLAPVYSTRWVEG